MKLKNCIPLALFFSICIDVSSIFAEASNPSLQVLGQQTTDNQSGADMQSINNIMFHHSIDLYPLDDPQIRYINAESIYHFQPADGSTDNGTYSTQTGMATTNLHDYEQVIAIDGTNKQPSMNKQNQYTDTKGKILDFVGLFDAYSDNIGEKRTYYLFGIIKNNKNNENKENIGFATYPQQ